MHAKQKIIMKSFQSLPVLKAEKQTTVVLAVLRRWNISKQLFCFGHFLLPLCRAQNMASAKMCLTMFKLQVKTHVTTLEVETSKIEGDQTVPNAVNSSVLHYKQGHPPS